MKPNTISKESAKALIDDCTFGVLVITKAEPVPAIGSVDPEEMKVQITANSYQFGETDAQ